MIKAFITGFDKTFTLNADVFLNDFHLNHLNFLSQGIAIRLPNKNTSKQNKRAKWRPQICINRFALEKEKLCLIQGQRKQGETWSQRIVWVRSTILSGWRLKWLTERVHFGFFHQKLNFTVFFKNLF